MYSRTVKHRLPIQCKSYSGLVRLSVPSIMIEGVEEAEAEDAEEVALPLSDRNPLRVRKR